MDQLANLKDCDLDDIKAELFKAILESDYKAFCENIDDIHMVKLQIIAKQMGKGFAFKTEKTEECRKRILDEIHKSFNYVLPWEA